MMGESEFERPEHNAVVIPSDEIIEVREIVARHGQRVFFLLALFFALEGGDAVLEFPAQGRDHLVRRR